MTAGENCLWDCNLTDAKFLLTNKNTGKTMEMYGVNEAWVRSEFNGCTKHITVEQITFPPHYPQPQP